MLKVFFWALVCLLLVPELIHAQGSNRDDNAGSEIDEKDGFFGFGYGYWSFVSLERSNDWDDDDYGSVGVHVPFLQGGFHVSRNVDILFGAHIPGGGETMQFYPEATVVEIAARFKMVSKVSPFVQIGIATPLIYPYPLAKGAAGLKFHFDHTHGLVLQANALLPLAEASVMGIGGSANYEVSF